MMDDIHGSDRQSNEEPRIATPPLHDHGANTIEPSSSRVRFTNLEIIELPIILGDSPACSSKGVPLSVGWDEIKRTQVEINSFEANRGPRKTTRSELMISPKERKDILLRSGVSREEIAAAKVQVKKDRQDRLISQLDDIEKQLAMYKMNESRFGEQNDTYGSESSRKTGPSLNPIQDALLMPSRHESPKVTPRFRKKPPNRSFSSSDVKQQDARRPNNVPTDKFLSPDVGRKGTFSVRGLFEVSPTTSEDPPSPPLRKTSLSPPPSPSLHLCDSPALAAGSETRKKKFQPSKPFPDYEDLLIQAQEVPQIENTPDGSMASNFESFLSNSSSSLGPPSPPVRKGSISPPSPPTDTKRPLLRKLKGEASSPPPRDLVSVSALASSVQRPPRVTKSDDLELFSTTKENTKVNYSSRSKSFPLYSSPPFRQQRASPVLSTANRKTLRENLKF